jgi:cutinase
VVRLAAVALLVLVAACGKPAAGPSSSSSSSPSSSSSSSSSASVVSGRPARFTEARCADLVVLGLRGQTQSSRSDGGVGHEVLVSVQQTVAHLEDTSVRLEAVRYPAVREATDAGYDADVASGVRMVTRRLGTLARSCPRSRFVVVGFSEGAQVGHLAAVRLAPAEADRVAAVALLGDPLRDPSDAVRTETFGTGPLAGRGNAGPGPAFPMGIRDRVLLLCARGDDVCNAPPTGRVGPPSVTHRTFYEQPSSARTTGRLVASVVSAGTP